MIKHYYHVYADGTWQAPVREHLTTLSYTGLDAECEMTVGIVGRERNRNTVKRFINDKAVAFVEESTGFEQVTISHMQNDLDSFDGPVLYAHTKGAWNMSTLNNLWRWSMTRQVVKDWRKCVELLDSVDAVGCHWLTPATFPWYFQSWKPRSSTPFFAGTFWWANADYLKKLPPVGTESRYDAERWIGLGSPAVHDLLPGFPSEKLFRCGMV